MLAAVMLLEGDRVLLGVKVPLGVTVGVPVPAALRVVVGLVLALPVLVLEAVMVALQDGLILGLVLTVKEPVLLRVWLTVAPAVPLLVTVPLMLGVPLRVLVPEGLAPCKSEGVGDTLCVHEFEGVLLCEPIKVTELVTVPVLLQDTLALPEPLFEALFDALPVCVRVPVRVAVGVKEGVVVISAVKVAAAVTVPLPLCVTVRVPLGVRVLVPVAVAVIAPVPLTVLVEEIVCDGELEKDAVLVGEKVADGDEVTVDAAVCVEEPLTVCVVVLVGLFDAVGVCGIDAVPEIVTDDDGVFEPVKDGVRLKDADCDEVTVLVCVGVAEVDGVCVGV